MLVPRRTIHGRWWTTFFVSSSPSKSRCASWPINTAAMPSRSQSTNFWDFGGGMKMLKSIRECKDREMIEGEIRCMMILP